MSFITGEVPVDTSTPAAAEVFAPPPEDVRREMMRLQMDAQRANLVAETVALKADELARLGIHVSELGGEEPVVDDVAVPEAPEGVAEDALEAADSAATAELMPGEPESAASDLEPAEPEPAEPEPEADNRG
jgi:hypothetical protein